MNQEGKKQWPRARGRHVNLVGRVRWPPGGTPRPWAGLGLQGAWTELSPPQALTSVGLCSHFRPEET